MAVHSDQVTQITQTDCSMRLTGKVGRTGSTSSLRLQRLWHRARVHRQASAGRKAIGKGILPKEGWFGKISGPGEVRNDTALLNMALSGNDDFAFRAFSVDQATYNRAFGFISNYARWNNYNLFYNNCETAALRTLNYSGAVPNAFFIPFTLPSELYGALERGGGV